MNLRKNNNGIGGGQGGDQINKGGSGMLTANDNELSSLG